MKKIKMFAGIEAKTKEGTTYYPDLTLFDNVNCKAETKSEIIRALIINYPFELDLTEFTESGETLILKLIPGKK